MVTILRSEERAAHWSVGPSARPWARTGSVDVEVLAQWAFGAQMVDRFERVGLHAIEAVAAGYEVSQMSADGVGQLMQIEHLGCRIDRSAGLVSDAVHPVALAVSASLAKVPEGERVRRYALAGTRPSGWREPEAKVRPQVWVKEGERAQVEYLGPGKTGAYCPIVVVWDRQREAWERAQYTAWWDALAELGWQLSTRALGFTVTGPAAPAMPWEATGAPPLAGPPSPAPDQ